MSDLSIEELIFSLETCSESDFFQQVAMIEPTILELSDEVTNLENKIKEDNQLLIGSEEKSELDSRIRQLIPFYILLSYRDRQDLRDGIPRVIAPVQPFKINEKEIYFLNGFCFISYSLGAVGKIKWEDFEPYSKDLMKIAERSFQKFTIMRLLIDFKMQQNPEKKEVLQQTLDKLSFLYKRIDCF